MKYKYSYLFSSLDIHVAPAPAPPLHLAPVSLQVLVLLGPEYVHQSEQSSDSIDQSAASISPEHVHLRLPEHGVPRRVFRHGQGRRLLLGEVGAELVLHHLNIDQSELIIDNNDQSVHSIDQ